MVRRPRTIAGLLILLAAVSVSTVLWRNTVLPVSDFTSFWIAGHSLLGHRNPYDARHAQEAERAMGLTQGRPFVMRNPPWVLWITLPLGMLTYRSAWLLWTVFLIFLVAYSARMLWAIYDSSGRQRATPLLLSFFFAPTLACLSVGQTAPIVLFGLTLFLYLDSQHEFWAGFALIAAAVKPHLAFLFWLILALWSLQHRKWKRIAGAISSIALAMAVAVMLDSQVMRQYRTMLTAESLDTQFIPTLGGILRQFLGPAWLQVFPATLGIAGSLVYYFRRRQTWSWKQSLPGLLLVSMLATPYAWLIDEVVLLIALIAAAAGIRQNRLGVQITVLFVIVNAAIVMALASGVRVVSPYYSWTIWAWIFFYFVGTRNRLKRKQQIQAAVGAEDQP